MRVLPASGLIVLLASLVSCEERTIDRCLLPDFPCQDGYFCKEIPDDPNHIGMCSASECTFSATPSTTPNRCGDALPICTSAGRCVACSNDNECNIANTAKPVCNMNTTQPTLGQCGECNVAGDCKNPANPACNTTTHLCQPCTQHSQCIDSGVCVKDDTLANLPAKTGGGPLTRGTCVPASRVLTVDFSCAKTSCSLQGQLAKASDLQPYVLIRSYGATMLSKTITVPMIASLPELHIVSPAGDGSPAQPISGSVTEPPTISEATQPNTLVVQPGASVTFEGVAIINSNTALLCDSDNSLGVPAAPVTTSVKLIRSIISNSSIGVVTHAKCQLTVDQSWIGWRPPSVTSIGSGNFQAMTLDSTQFDITNTIFIHNYTLNFSFGGITITDKSTLGLPGHIVNCTFDKQDAMDPTSHNAMDVYCPSAITKVAIFNNIFVNTAPAMSNGRHHVDPACITATSFGYNATDESPAPAGTNIVTTGVTEAILATSTLALQANAPTTVSAGGTPTFTNGTDKVTSPTVDIIGAARNGTTPSIGAYELAH